MWASEIPNLELGHPSTPTFLLCLGKSWGRFSFWSFLHVIQSRGAGGGPHGMSCRACTQTPGTQRGLAHLCRSLFPPDQLWSSHFLVICNHCRCIAWESLAMVSFGIVLNIEVIFTVLGFNGKLTE